MSKDQTNELDRKIQMLTKEYIDRGYPLLLSSKQAASLLGQNTDSWLRKMRSSGYVSGIDKGNIAPPFVRRGGRVLYRLDDLIRYICQMPSYQW